MEYFAVADVALLIVLFFHRYMLRKLGLWKDANIQDTFLSIKSFANLPLKSEEVTASTSIDTIDNAIKDSISVVDETKTNKHNIVKIFNV